MCVVAGFSYLDESIVLMEVSLHRVILLVLVMVACYLLWVTICHVCLVFVWLASLPSLSQKHHNSVWVGRSFSLELCFFGAGGR
jgi:hypothetical protein